MSEATITIEDRCQSLANRINETLTKDFGKNYGTGLYHVVLREMTMSEEEIIESGQKKLKALTPLERKLLGLV